MYMPWTVEVLRDTLLLTLHRVVYIVDFFSPVRHLMDSSCIVSFLLDLPAFCQRCLRLQ